MGKERNRKGNKKLETRELAIEKHENRFKNKTPSFIKMSQYDSDSATTSGAQSVFSQGGSFSIFQPEPRKFSWMALAMLGVMLSLIVALFIQVIKLITERENIEEKIAHLEEIVIEPKRPKVVI